MNWHKLKTSLRAVLLSSPKFYGGMFLLILALTNIRQRVVTNFDCEICSDKAGYYMYLPAVFYLGFEAKAYPEGMDTEHGEGFHIQRAENKVVTKFTCGVAILLAPFYGVGVAIDKLLGLEVAPYSNYFLFFISIASAFYAVLGLYFLRKWLRFYVDDWTAVLSLLLVFFGSNLLYYTLDENLMSHLYSFTLFSAVLWGAKAFSERKEIRFFLLFVFALSLAILIRPTNALFALFALLMDVRSWEDVKQKLLIYVQPKLLLLAAIVFLLTVLPQLLYWHYAYGKYIVWSYEGEGFIFWNHPQWMEVWFSPQSGVFTYTPLVLLALVVAVIMRIRKLPNAFLVMVTFIVVSYLCAAWHNPYFGECNFGKRPMIEYFPLILFPLSYMIQRFSSFPKAHRKLLLMCTLFCVYYNLTLFAAFDTCFFGAPWEWDTFGRFLLRALPIIH